MHLWFDENALETGHFLMEQSAILYGSMALKYFYIVPLILVVLVPILRGVPTIQAAVITVSILGLSILTAYRAYTSRSLNLYVSFPLIFAWACFISVAVSSWHSIDFTQSLLSVPLSADTVLFSFLSALLITFGYVFLQEEKNLRISVRMLGISSALVLLSELIYLLLVAVGRLTGNSWTMSASLTGTWTDLAILAGFVFVYVLSLSVFVPVALSKNVQRATLVLAVFIALLVNELVVWGVMLFSTVIILILGRTVPTTYLLRSRVWAITLVACAVVAMIFPTVLGGLSTSLTGPQPIDLRPSYKSMQALAESVQESSLVYGFGPNTFETVWNKYQPKELGSTSLGEVTFSSGSSAFSTQLVTGGYIGVALFTLLLLSVLSITLYRFRSKSAYLQSLAAPLVYLTALFFFFQPGLTVYVLYALIAGLAAGYSFHLLSPVVMQLQGTSRLWSGVFVLILGAVLVYSSVALYAFALVNTAERSLVSSSPILAKASTNAAWAHTILRDDRSLRVQSEAERIAITMMLTSASSSVNQKLFADKSKRMIALSDAAVRYNPSNYLNLLERARAYHALVPLKISGSYEASLDSYKRAIENRPNAPDLCVERSLLEVARGDNATAVEQLRSCIKRRLDYAPAHVALIRVLANAGQDELLARALSDFSLVDGGNAELIFQLGATYERLGEPAKAEAEYRRARSVTPTHVEATFALARLEASRGELALARQTLLTLGKHVQLQRVNEFANALFEGVNPFVK